MDLSNDALSAPFAEFGWDNILRGSQQSSWLKVGTQS
jgi:hypothetical protein